MTSRAFRGKSRTSGLFGVLTATAAILAACSSTASSGTTTTTSMVTTTTSTTAAPKAGTANLGFAGSTQVANETVVGPAFTKATGYTYQGQGAGSAAVAQYIISGQYTSNVFESVGGTAIKTLEPKFTNYYVSFASSQLVIAYNPTGPFAAKLAAIAKGTQPVSSLFDVMASSGFKLGRTDPNVDPQGQGFLLMLNLAQSQLGIPAATAQGVLANSQVFAETSLESTLQAGQLDASSAYLSQAIQMKLPYITLPDTINLGNADDASIYSTATITLTQPAGKVVTGSPLTLCITTINQPGESADDTAAANAFVQYVLSPAGLALYKQEGYTVLPAKLYGSSATLPPAIASEIVSTASPTSSTTSTSAP